MAAPDLDAHVTTQLRSLLDDDAVSVLLGAGASMTVGLPSWESLAVNVLLGSAVIDDPGVAESFLRGQDVMLAVESARGVLDSDEWASLLQESLYKGTSPFPSAMHRAVAQLVAEREHGSTRLFTLNFDVLLEEAVDHAMLEVGRSVTSFPRASDTPRGGDSTLEVHHLHGVIAPPPAPAPTAVVLGLADFVGLPTRTWQFGELQQALQRGPLVLAGTSYRDPDMREWIFELTRDRDDARVIALLARASMGLTRSEFESVREALVRQWRSVGVEPILLHDHADAAQAVRELLQVDGPDYRPPSERAASLWEALGADFATLQRRHAEALEEDLAELVALLGPETNVTLWVADGDGSLVRWASPDRTYRNLGALRRVSMGHDSPWLAGRCLAIDDVLAHEPADDPEEVRRWRSVVAAPITVQLPGGPPFASAVLSTATSSRLEDHEIDEWFELLGGRTTIWAERLETIAGGGVSSAGI